MNENLICTFCGKTDLEVLITGPGGVHICNECVDLCNQIIHDHRIRKTRDTINRVFGELWGTD